MRAIWSGSISFGLVNIPIKLYSAVEPKTLALHFLHEKDLSPIRYSRICQLENKEVPYDEIIKGYPLEEKIIPLTESDFDKADLKETHSIQISNFINEAEIDSIYYDRPYYLEPTSSSAKAYSLLRIALARSNRLAVAKFVLRNREHLVVLKPADNILILNEIRFYEEIRPKDELKIPTIEMTEQEIGLALALIDQLTTKFNPEQYHDTYTERLEQIIQEKAKGEIPKAFGQIPRPTEIQDLMTTLKASLEKNKEKAR